MFLDVSIYLLTDRARARNDRFTKCSARAGGNGDTKRRQNVLLSSYYIFDVTYCPGRINATERWQINCAIIIYAIAQSVPFSLIINGNRA